jgi:quercetin dioxygenase-like cupin family protein
METTMLDMIERTAADRLAEGDGARPTAADQGWTAHPSFAGVSLKVLADAAATGGALRTLMVRISPNCAMLPHRHDRETEQHFVVAGAGRADLDGHGIDYAPGRLMIIPPATTHSVRAGDEGLVLMALFVPAKD